MNNETSNYNDLISAYAKNASLKRAFALDPFQAYALMTAFAEVAWSLYSVSQLKVFEDIKKAMTGE